MSALSKAQANRIAKAKAVRDKLLADYNAGADNGQAIRVAASSYRAKALTAKRQAQASLAAGTHNVPAIIINKELSRIADDLAYLAATRCA